MFKVEPGLICGEGPKPREEKREGYQFKMKPRYFLRQPVEHWARKSKR
jgi:hypothetical protein